MKGDFKRPYALKYTTMDFTTTFSYDRPIISHIQALLSLLPPFLNFTNTLLYRE